MAAGVRATEDCTAADVTGDNLAAPPADARHPTLKLANTFLICTAKWPGDYGMKSSQLFLFIKRLGVEISGTARSREGQARISGARSHELPRHAPLREIRSIILIYFPRAVSWLRNSFGSEKKNLGHI